MGRVYILSNPSMPGIYKIGATQHDPISRALDLHTTGVPTPFKLEYEIDHDYPFDLEAAAHRELRDFRVANNRQFFHLPLKKAIKTIATLAVETEIAQRAAKIAQRPMLLLSKPAEVGQALRQARKSLGLTQGALACANNVGVRVVCEIERGKPTAQLGIVLKLLHSVGLLLAIENPVSVVGG